MSCSDPAADRFRRLRYASGRSQQLLAGCGKIVVSDQFLGWLESFWSFRASES